MSDGPASNRWTLTCGTITNAQGCHNPPISLMLRAPQSISTLTLSLDLHSLGFLSQPRLLQLQTG